GTVAGYSPLIVVPPDSDSADIDTLLSQARSSNQAKSIAAVGHQEELSVILLQKLTGLEFVTVPYGGQSSLLTDLVSGRIDMAFLSIPVAQPLIESGKIRAIAVTSASRMDSYPSLPTMQEAGAKGFSVDIWNGLIAPRGTSEDRVKVLSDTLHEVLDSPEVKAKLTMVGLHPIPDTPQEMGAKIAKSAERWKAVVKEA